MQKTTRYIQKSLEGIYPPEEIRAMTRLIWEDACGFSPVDVILRKDTVFIHKIDFISQVKERILDAIWA